MNFNLKALEQFLSVNNDSDIKLPVNNLAADNSGNNGSVFSPYLANNSNNKDVPTSGSDSTTKAKFDIKNFIENNYNIVNLWLGLITANPNANINNMSPRERAMFEAGLIPDGKIDYACQFRIGNCWMLGQLNSLSQTEFGAEVIKKAITKNEDGSYTVTFEGDNKSYIITESEIKSARALREYSRGDVDMLIMELAFEKLFNEFGIKAESNVTSVAQKRTGSSLKKEDVQGCFFIDKSFFIFSKTGEIVNTNKSSAFTQKQYDLLLDEILNSINKNGDGDVKKEQIINWSFNFDKNEFVVKLKNGSEYTFSSDKTNDLLLNACITQGNLPERSIEGNSPGVGLDNKHGDVLGHLTGKFFSVIQDENTVTDILKKKATNPNLAIVFASFYNINTGEKFKANGAHEYSLKNVQLDENGNIINVEVINPWDNGEVLNIPYDKFMKFAKFGTTYNLAVAGLDSFDYKTSSSDTWYGIVQAKYNINDNKLILAGVNYLKQYNNVSSTDLKLPQEIKLPAEITMPDGSKINLNNAEGLVDARHNPAGVPKVKFPPKMKRTDCPSPLPKDQRPSANLNISQFCQNKVNAGKTVMQSNGEIFKYDSEGRLIAVFADMFAYSDNKTKLIIEYNEKGEPSYQMNEEV